MEDLLNKAEKSLRGMKHVDAKDLALRTILPILRQMLRENAKVFSAVEANFHNIFSTLSLDETQGDFLQATFQHVTGLHEFVDELLLAAGFLVTDEEGMMKPSESIPSGILEKLLSFQQQGALWFAQYEAVSTAIEEDLDDDDDDFDDDDDDDFEDDELEASGEGEPETEAEEPQPAEEPASENPAETQEVAHG